MAIFHTRVYRTSDGRYVTEGDPDAAFLAYAVGTEVTDVVAERGGLLQWVRMGSRPPAMVMDSQGRVSRYVVGTTPAGHATASPPGVPSEVAPPVVANAAVVSSTAQLPAAAPAQPARTTGSKPARTTREV